MKNRGKRPNRPRLKVKFILRIKIKQYYEKKTTAGGLLCQSL